MVLRRVFPPVMLHDAQRHHGDELPDAIHQLIGVAVQRRRSGRVGIRWAGGVSSSSSRFLKEICQPRSCRGREAA